MDVQSIARLKRRARNPLLAEASEHYAAATLNLYQLERGTIEFRAAAAVQRWWLDEIRRLNPGGAEIIRFPVPSEPKRQGRA